MISSYNYLSPLNATIKEGVLPFHSRRGKKHISRSSGGMILKAEGRLLVRRFVGDIFAKIIRDEVVWFMLVVLV